MKFIVSPSLFLLLTGASISSSFTSKTTYHNLQRKIANKSNPQPLFVAASFNPPDTRTTFSITEDACAEAASLMKQVDVPVSESISATGTAAISYIHWPAEKQTNTLPLLLVHGFDSSCLEFRRLGPKLAALGISVYAVDLLGWGFTQLDDIDDFSADAKIEALKSFWKTVGNNGPVCVGGASLGGASAIEFASDPSSPAEAAIMIDAQGFTDGIGPPSLLPPFLARLGVKVLKSEGLRDSANQMSYFDKETFATKDALKTGRIHCLREGWEDAQLNFIKSGGFYPSEKVKKVTQKTLVLWGNNDGILDREQYATQFMDNLPDAELRLIEDCGHVPHLEKSDECANLIKEFLKSEELIQKKNSLSTPSYDVAVGAAVAAAGVAGAALTLGGPF